MASDALANDFLAALATAKADPKLFADLCAFVEANQQRLKGDEASVAKARAVCEHVRQLTGGKTGPTADLALMRPVKIYADGIFDLTHSGHFNAMRQARQLGDFLCVGVVSDAEALATKGSSPIYSEDERAELIAACKWVDAIHRGAPYAVSNAFLEETGCDFVAHGDDFAPCADGSDCYAEPRASGKMKIFKRTEGVSTTTLVSRLLLATRDLEQPMEEVSPSQPLPLSDWVESALRSERASQQVLMSTRRLMQFMQYGKPPKPTDKIVYVDGSFDVFHVGHVRTLQRARALGDYLVVGVHDDATVRGVKGPGFPLSSLLERALNVLAVRGVDEVIIGAPWKVTDYLLKSFKIDVVAKGTQMDAWVDPQWVGASGRGGAGCVPGSGEDSPPAQKAPSDSRHDCYEVPRQMGILKEIESDSAMTTYEILRRIVRNRATLVKSIAVRGKKEESHYSQQLNNQRDIAQEL